MEEIRGVLNFTAENDKIEAKVGGTDLIEVLAQHAGKNIVVTIKEEA